MRRAVAEALGTFFLVLMGCGAIIVNDLFGGFIGHFGIAMAFGAIVMIMIYAIGNISGAHMNPAVSLGFALAGRIEARTLLWYLPSQAIGAITASVLLRLAFPAHETLGATLPSLPPISALLIEALMTALLMFVILNVSTGHMEKGIMAGVAVGGTIALEALVAGPLTGASMNPFRSLAPALVSGHMEYLWLYLAGPVLGVLIAFPSCRLIQGEECCLPVGSVDQG